MEFKPKKREWVKSAAIVFLAVLLVLTFFSNTIMNRTLPEVATQMVNSGSVTSRVRGSGTVVANGSHQVKADQTREIRSVMVKEGQEISAGDVLFVLGEDDGDELEAAQEQLRQLQLSYQQAAINSPVFSYSTDERKIKELKLAYDEAQKAADAAFNRIPKADQEAISAAKQELDEAQAKLDELTAAFEQRRLDALNRVEEAQARVDELRRQLENEPEPSVPPVENTPEPTPSPTPSPSPDPEDPAAGQEAWLDPVSLLRPAAAGTGGTGSLEEQLKQAEEELAAAQLALDQMKIETDPAIQFATELRDKAQAKYDSLTNSPSSPEMVAYNTALAELRAAENAYLDAKDALEQKKISDNKSLASAGLTLSDLSTQIEKQKEKIEELSGGAGNQVLANVSGTVESIECTAGDLKQEGDILCTIEVPDMGYTLSFSVTNDQARRLAPGDTATVSNYYWGSQIVATLSTIRVDPKNPQSNKLLTFDLEGDVTAGSEVTLSVGQRSAGYDTIVPNSAIRSDSNGSFVLKIESKSSPLGNRYIARRVDVEVLASDDVNSAVMGDLTTWEYVITTSNSPVNNGDMVRMADN